MFDKIFFEEIAVLEIYGKTEEEKNLLKNYIDMGWGELYCFDTHIEAQSCRPSYQTYTCINWYDINRWMLDAFLSIHLFMYLEYFFNQLELGSIQQGFKFSFKQCI